MGAESNRGLMEIQDNNRRALEAAFERLEAAEERSRETTIPHTPLGRPRVFRVAQYYWPVRQSQHSIGLMRGCLYLRPWPEEPRERVFLSPYSFGAAVAEILTWTGNQPRRVWRVIRQINAIAAWCEKRAEGRKRAAAEILRQQEPWAKKIAAEVLIEELASGIDQRNTRPDDFVKTKGLDAGVIFGNKTGVSRLPLTGPIKVIPEEEEL